jgi:hypothetical protein
VGEFLSDAPTATLVLFFLALPLIFVPMTVYAIRIARAQEAQEPRSPIQEQRPGVRGPLALELVGWTLFVAGLVIYVVD